MSRIRTSSAKRSPMRPSDSVTKEIIVDFMEMNEHSSIKNGHLSSPLPLLSSPLSGGKKNPQKMPRIFFRPFPYPDDAEANMKNSSLTMPPKKSGIPKTHDSVMDKYYLEIYYKSFEAFERARLVRDEEEKQLQIATQKEILNEAAYDKKNKNKSKSKNFFYFFKSITKCSNKNNNYYDVNINKHKGYEHPEISMYIQILTYLGYVLLTMLGYISDFCLLLFSFKYERKEPGYAPIVHDFDDFYRRRFYCRLHECFNHPLNSRPGRIIGIMERNKSLDETGNIIPAINMGSYNYLGFAEHCDYAANRLLDSIDNFGIGACASTADGGLSDPLDQLQRTVACFLGKQDAVTCSMGFFTNFGGIPSLMDKGTIVLSDQLNHASLICGIKASAGKVQVFPHGKLDLLEKMIKEAIIKGQDRTHLPWKRIVIMAEGVYSMDGEICPLRRLVELKKKYKCLLYIDEAHSIGALGVTGRGICEYAGVSPDDVDILMGTFTKSFGSIGGYIAGNADIINSIRHTSSLTLSSDALSPGCAEQALSVFKMLLGDDGTTIAHDRITQLAENSRFFREGLKNLGLTVYGEDCSPVVPVLVYIFGKLPSISRELLARNIAIVVVGYPACALMECRVRFCVSAAHTKEDLQHIINAMADIANEYKMIYQPENIKTTPALKA